MRYKYSEKELKTLLNNLVIICDTREQKSEHILNYFDKKNKKYKIETLKQGDYSCYIESNEETKPLGVLRDWHFDTEIVIERKNSIDELVQSFKERDRFSDEFNRINKYNIKPFMFVEDDKVYDNMNRGNFRSKYSPTSLLATFETFIARFNLNIMFVNKDFMGFKIYQTCYYHLSEILKNKGFIDE